MKKMPSDRDMELTSVSTTKENASFSLGSTRSMRADNENLDSLFRNTRPGGRTRGKLARWVDSFRRDPHTRVTYMPRASGGARNSLARSIEEGGGSTVADDDDVEGGMRVRSHRGAHYFDLHAAAVRTANPLLARELKGRHLQMIAIGGSIGACLKVWGWVGSIMLTRRHDRNWTVCRVGQGASPRRPGVGVTRLHVHRGDVVFHHASTGGASCLVPRGWFVLILLNEVPRPSLGVCHGMEVSPPPLPPSQTRC